MQCEEFSMWTGFEVSSILSCLVFVKERVLISQFSADFDE